MRLDWPRRAGVLGCAVVASFAVACGGEPRRAPAGTRDTGVAGMPGMHMSADSGSRGIVLSGEQIEHGHIRWGRVDAETTTSTVTVPASITPNEDRTIRLGAPAGGRILAVRVAPGDRVARGELLLTMQSPDAGMAQSDVAKAVSAVTAARAEATFAASARARAERLLTLKAMPRQDYERAVAEDEAARATLDQALAELRRARATAEALGAGASASGQIAIRSTLAGVVLERTAVPGAVVEAGAPLVVVTDPASLWLMISAPEALSGAFARGRRVQFTVPAYPTDTFDARVSAVAAGLDPDTRVLPVRALIANGRNQLKPEMLATAIVGGAAGPVIVVPDAAVQSIDGHDAVFVAEPDVHGGARMTMRSVTVGGRTAGRATITAGLTPGDTIVLDGAFAVRAELEKAGLPKMEM